MSFTQYIVAQHVANQQQHVVFSGGGTAGHLFPGLAVAQQLSITRPDVQITFCGNGQPFERTHVHRAGFDYRGFPCHPLPRSLRRTWRFLRDNHRGIRMATQFIDDLHVSLVVGLGGYASVPMARAAARRNLPLVLLEQNAVAGRATRLLASAATAVCLSLPPARRRLRWSLPVQITGNPVRAAVVEAALHRTPSPARRLVVVGGSRGAGELNQHVPKALYKLREWLSGWEIVHQCGDRDLETTQTLYGKLALAARLEAFIDDLPTVLSAADLAICRAGGTTLAELAVLGVPAVLVPYAEAADDHQRHNALWFAEAGAAVVVERPVAGRRLDDSLAEAILPLVRQSELRASMAASISRRARPHAAHEIARLVESLLRPDQVADAA